MNIYALRLKPNQDLKKELKKFVIDNNIKAAFIITCVGSLKQATLRLADEKIIKTYKKKFEIVSLKGTLSLAKTHIHLALADEKGHVIGGHLKEGSLIYSTAEIIIGESKKFEFLREFDKETGFEELVIKELKE